MPTKVISFLGLGNYSDTMYVYNGQEYLTPFMAEAAFHFFIPDTLLVFVTKEAKEKTLPLLTNRLPEATPVDIPSGKSEEELWQIFDRISSSIDLGDQVIMDITNAFRSIPILSFISLSFVRTVRNINVSKLIYGAFDASIDGKTPVFDLTPFLNLLDWTTATDAFLKYGRADDLVPLARHGYSDIANTLDELTKSLQTSRTAGVMQSAHGLSEKIATSRNPHKASSMPFHLLLDQINHEYSDFGLDDPTNHVGEYLEKQLDMIKWYISKGMYVQALTSMREWLITLVMYHNNSVRFTHTPRNSIARSINENRCPSGIDTTLFAKVNSVWQAIRDFRNDVAHSGQSHDARPFDEIARKSKDFYQQLEELFRLQRSLRP